MVRPLSPCNRTHDLQHKTRPMVCGSTARCVEMKHFKAIAAPLFIFLTVGI